MKRKTEMLFSMIGVSVFLILSIGSFSLLGRQNDANIEGLIKYFMHDENISDISADQINIFLSNGLLYLAIISIIFIILGVISIVMLKKNTKAAGKVLIITGVLSTLFTLFTGVIGGMAYLIAGLITFFRKPKDKIVQERNRYNG